ncbi:MAG: hypothetical protein ACEQSX_18060 [Baekduiaceae bacterium]
MNDAEYYASALECVKVARELRTELTRVCPDAIVEDAIGARTNVAARAALRTACEIIEHNPPKDWTAHYFEGHWSGMIEAAMKIISAVEMEMYDPREYPERYEIKARGVDNQSGSD